MVTNQSLKPMAYNYLISYARSFLLSALKESVDKGHLILIEGTQEHRFGRHSQSQNYVSATVKIKSADFWIKLFLRHDLGFAEAYMDGDFESPDLKAILYLSLDNPQLMGSLVSLPYRIFSLLSAVYIRFLGQTLSKAVQNAVTGYDCSNDFFKIFLSEDMTYSCALWSDEIGGVRGDLEKDDKDDTLRQAQMNKIHHILDLARIKPGDRLLEFGSGWGSMAIEAAKRGCTVDTITLSIEQKCGAEDRIKQEGLQDLITVHLIDYRKLPAEFKGSFDAFVSVEMVEAVGISNLALYFQIVDWALKPTKGAAVVQLTTQPEFRHTVYQSSDYARLYQWPNSYLPSATSFITTATSATRGRLCLESTVDYGTHYPRTLRDWRRRLDANWNDDLVVKIRSKHPELKSDEAIAAFKRKWEYMCIYAEVGYARAYTSLHIMSFVRPENVKYLCD